MADAPRPTPQDIRAPARHPWTLPRLAELPKLTALTLASAIGGTGGTGGSGSTVFGILLALISLAACTSDRSMEPSAAAGPRSVASISCVGDTRTGVIGCGAPAATAGHQEIVGGAGVRVVLHSSNVHYTAPNFTFDVAVQNLGVQSLGSDGVSNNGVRVFFDADPVVTGGTGTITVVPDSVGTFSTAGQPYYIYGGAIDPQGYSDTVSWHLTMPATVTSFTFTVEVAADVFDQGGVLRWIPVNGATARRILDVVASASNDRMAVGSSGITARFHGGTWREIPVTSSGEDFTAVVAVAPGQYLATTSAEGSSTSGTATGP